MNNTENLILWAQCALVRAIKTFAQTLVALIGTGYIAFGDVDWAFNFSVAGVSFILSILTSIAGLPEVKAEDEVQLLKEEVKEYTLTTADTTEFKPEITD